MRNLPSSWFGGCGGLLIGCRVLLPVKSHANIKRSRYHLCSSNGITVFKRNAKDERMGF